MVCYLCGQNKYETIFEYTELDKYEKMIINDQPEYYRRWVKCSNCGLICSMSNFIGNLDEMYSKGYRSREFRGETPEEAFNKIISLPKEQSENHYRVQYVKTKYSELTDMFSKTEPINKKRKVLDIGFGFCIFLGVFIDGEWEGHGIDPDPSTCKFAREKLKINVYNGQYKKGLFGTQFDLITIIHVLEHMKKPIEFLKDVKEDLKDNGLVYIEIPDAVSFKLMDKNEDVFNSGHYYMFSLSTIIKILSEAGFTILNIRRIISIRGNRNIMLMAAKSELDKK